MKPETIAQYNKVKDLCKKINIDYTLNMSIKEVATQCMMKFQTLDTIGGLAYKFPIDPDPQMASLCEEVGIKWDGEPSVAFYEQFWNKTGTFDQINKELLVLKEFL